MSQIPSPFTSRIKFLEYLCVLEGAKPCARILSHESKTGELLAYLQAQGLRAETSNFKLKKTDTEIGYSDSSIQIPLTDKEEGHIVVYFSKDPIKAMQAKDLEGMGRHKELGRVLGYPECCCDFFVKNFGEGHTDLTLDSLKNTQSQHDTCACHIPWQLNLAARHFDAALLFHFPCSMQCAESLRLANRHFDVLKKNDGKVAEESERIMRTPALYTTTEGVFLFPNALIDESKSIMRFTTILKTKKSKLFYALSDALMLDFSHQELQLGQDMLPKDSHALILAR